MKTMDKKYVLISLEDGKAKKISKILGSRTCKKIIDFLSDVKEASEKDIAEALEMPLNTLEYNLKKLVDVEFVEKTKNFFWSKKGKKIPMYKLSNKSVIISPRNKLSKDIKSVLPAAIISGVGALMIRQYFLFKQKVPGIEQKVFSAESAENFAEVTIQGRDLLVTHFSSAWLWFLTGAIFALMIFLIFKFIKLKQKASPLAASFSDARQVQGGKNA